MNEFPIDDIHRMIDDTEEIIRTIDNMPRGDIDVTDLGDLSLIVLEILGGTRTAYTENSLGINASLLNKFVKMRGTVNKSQAMAVANRVRTYLKSEDQAFNDRSEDVTVSTKGPSETVESLGQSALGATFTVVPTQWISVKATSETKLKINVISTLLESIIDQTKGTNAPAEEQALTGLERQQLIAILETTLNVLKSPLVEKGILIKAEGILKEAGTKAAKEGIQQGLGKLMTVAGVRIAELLVSFFS